MAIPWGTPVLPTHCKCAEFSRWLATHGSNPTMVRTVMEARDSEGPLFGVGTQVSYLRPGGKLMRERYYHNAVVVRLLSVRYGAQWVAVLGLN